MIPTVLEMEEEQENELTISSYKWIMFDCLPLLISFVALAVLCDAIYKLYKINREPPQVPLFAVIVPRQVLNEVLEIMSRVEFRDVIEELRLTRVYLPFHNHNGLPDLAYINDILELENPLEVGENMVIIRGEDL